MFELCSVKVECVNECVSSLKSVLMVLMLPCSVWKVLTANVCVDDVLSLSDSKDSDGCVLFAIEVSDAVDVRRLE